MIFNANIDAVTQTYLAPKVADTVLKGNLLTLRLLGNAERWKGKKLGKAIQFAKPTTGGSFAGLDQFSVTQSDTKRRIEFDLRGYYQSVVVSQMEADMAASDENASVELIGEAMEEAGNSLADGVADTVFGDGSGNSSKDFLGTKAIVDDGGNVATYGGLSRTTYPTLKSTVVSVTGNLNSTSSLATADSGARYGKDRVNLMICNETKWTEYERLLQPIVLATYQTNGYEQATRTKIVPSMSALGGDIGFDALRWRGSGLVADQRCPDKVIYGFNMDWIKWYGLKSTHPNFKPVKIGGNSELEGVYSKDISENIGLSFSGLKDTINQYGRIGQFILLGNLVSFNPNRHYRIDFTA